MAPSKKSDKSKILSSRKKTSSSSSSAPADKAPNPFTAAPDAVQKFFTGHLDPSHIYIAHVDSKPRTFKRKIFLVPVAMNVAVALLFAWRARHILPYYLALLRSLLGARNETTFDTAAATWEEIAWEVGRRGFTFMLDLVLLVFVWPWPVEFCAGRAHGNPVRWRWAVGFRDKEIYVRRSRRDWDREVPALLASPERRQTLLSILRQATSATLIQQKTGYLTMDGYWDLDWAAMVAATALADSGDVPLKLFRCLVLLHDEERGWISLDMGASEDADGEERRRQVFAFRDGLVALDKEDLFFRWIEIVQFESTRPGGFGEDKQAEVAQKIREMFEKEGVNFDELWKESVGPTGPPGM